MRRKTRKEKYGVFSLMQRTEEEEKEEEGSGLVQIEGTLSGDKISGGRGPEGKVGVNMIEAHYIHT